MSVVISLMTIRLGKMVCWEKENGSKQNENSDRNQDWRNRAILTIAIYFHNTSGSHSKCILDVCAIMMCRNSWEALVSKMFYCYVVDNWI